ncbi:MAG: glycosyltransferase family 4 protein [Ghiorsea sp.]|nr:glycosyltransferase family 4 protein [Ghiorsea sp.]
MNVRKSKVLQAKRFSHQEAISDINFLFVGHITQVKGVLDVIVAASKLQAANWKLHIVGGASAEPETWAQAQSLIQAHDLQSKITLYGRVDDEKLAALYASSDVFVLPSYWEGYGIVFLEAMSLGLPVIATTAGAIPEVVAHNQTGLLVEAGDVSALAQAMQTLIVDADKRQLFAHHAKQHAEQAEDWQAIQQRMQTWWEKLYA